MSGVVDVGGVMDVVEEWDGVVGEEDAGEWVRELGRASVGESVLVGSVEGCVWVGGFHLCNSCNAIMPVTIPPGVVLGRYNTNVPFR